MMLQFDDLQFHSLIHLDEQRERGREGQIDQIVSYPSPLCASDILC